MPDNNKELYGYVLGGLTEDVDKLKNIVIFGQKNDKDSLIHRIAALEENNEGVSELKNKINTVYEKVLALETEDKKSRSKIMILLIILALSYINSLLPKIAGIMENIVKFL